MNTNSEFLVIDDDDVNNFICKSLIKEVTGTANIKVFNSPEKGIEYIASEYSEAEKKRPTLVLLDIYMPALTGWDVLKIFDRFSDAVKSQFKIFIVSSTSSELDLARVLASKYATGFVEKPLTSQKLNNLIAEYT